MNHKTILHTLHHTLTSHLIQVRRTSRKLDSSELKQCVAQSFVLPYIFSAFMELVELQISSVCSENLSHSKKLELHHTTCVFSATCIKHDKSDSFAPINYTGWPRIVTLSREVSKAMF